MLDKAFAAGTGEFLWLATRGFGAQDENGAVKLGFASVDHEIDWLLNESEVHD